MFTCARTQEALEAKLGEWRAGGLNVQGVMCDVSSREARQELVNKVGGLGRAPVTWCVTWCDVGFDVVCDVGCDVVCDVGCDLCHLVCDMGCDVRLCRQCAGVLQ